jgi:hypothetical protein
MTSTVAIASPGLDQSRAVARLIRRSRGRTVTLRGVMLPGEKLGLMRGPFDVLEQGAIDSLCDVIPTGGVATAALLRRGTIELGSVTMTEAALRFYDKPWSLALAAEAGVPVPRTWTNELDDLRFPIFYKSKIEGGGMRGLALRRADIPQNEELIYQEYIESLGTYGVGFIARAGKLVAAAAHYERESYPELGGSAVILEQARNQRLIEHVQSILRGSNFNGWGLVEFKYCPKRDDYVFMELNAKLWASCIFSFRNEPEFGRLLFKIEPTLPPVTRMVFVHRALARGWRYTLRSLPKQMMSAERDYGEGAWTVQLARLVLPSSAVTAVRKVWPR